MLVPNPSLLPTGPGSRCKLDLKGTATANNYSYLPWIESLASLLLPCTSLRVTPTWPLDGSVLEQMKEPQQLCDISAVLLVLFHRWGNWVPESRENVTLETSGPASFHRDLRPFGECPAEAETNIHALNPVFSLASPATALHASHALPSRTFSLCSLPSHHLGWRPALERPIPLVVPQRSGLASCWHPQYMIKEKRFGATLAGHPSEPRYWEREDGEAQPEDQTP